MVSWLGSVSNHPATTQNTLATGYQCSGTHTHTLALWQFFMGRRYFHQKYKNVVMLSCSCLGIKLVWFSFCENVNLVQKIHFPAFWHCLGVVVYRYLWIRFKKREKKNYPHQRAFFSGVRCSKYACVALNVLRLERSAVIRQGPAKVLLLCCSATRRPTTAKSDAHKGSSVSQSHRALIHQTPLYCKHIYASTRPTHSSRLCFIHFLWRARNDADPLRTSWN